MPVGFPCLEMSECRTPSAAPVVAADTFRHDGDSSRGNPEYSAFCSGTRFALPVRDMNDGLIPVIAFLVLLFAAGVLLFADAAIRLVRRR